MDTIVQALMYTLDTYENEISLALDNELNVDLLEECQATISRWSRHMQALLDIGEEFKEHAEIASVYGDRYTKWLRKFCIWSDRENIA